MTAGSVSVPSVGVPPPWGFDPGRGAIDAAAGKPTVIHTPFTWTGSPWSLTGVCMLNAVLGLLTIGIYSFWGRTEVRRRMWSSVRLLGEPLAYAGTGRELLKGFMAVLLALLVPLFVAGTAVVVYFGQASSMFVLYQGLLFAVIYPVLTAVAHYRARRYRLSRTAWRGIRGSLSGSSGEYGFLSWATALAYPFTLGWIAPYRAIALQRALISDTHLGAERLRFEGSSASLYGRFALLWFGSIALFVGMFGVIGALLGDKIDFADKFWYTTLTARDGWTIAGVVAATIFIWSILSSFYYARVYNQVARSTVLGKGGAGQDAATGFATHRFDLDVRGRDLIWLFVTNAAITYLTLYILKPVATARSMKYYTEHLRLVGPFDPGTLGQNPHLLDQSGEGLGQAFDLDAF